MSPKRNKRKNNPNKNSLSQSSDVHQQPPRKKRLARKSSSFDHSLASSRNSSVSFQRIANVRTSDERRMDYLADFLRGNNICAAFSIIINKQGIKEIVVAANNLHAKAKSNNAHACFIKKTLQYFFKFSQGEIQEDVRLEILEEVIRAKALSEVLLDLKERVKGVLGEPSFRTFLEQLISGSEPEIEEKPHLPEKIRDRQQAAYSLAKQYAKEVFRKFRSIEQFFLENKEIQFYRILFSGPENVHAEIRLFYYRAMIGALPLSPANDLTEVNKKIYVAISLSCCRSCWGFLQYYQNYIGQKDENKWPLHMAGTHGLGFKECYDPASFWPEEYFGQALVVSLGEGKEWKEAIQINPTVKNDFDSLLEQLKSFKQPVIAPSTPKDSKREHVTMHNSPEDYSPVLENNNFMPEVLRWSFDASTSKMLLKNNVGQEKPYNLEFVIEYIRTHDGKYPDPSNPCLLEINSSIAEPTPAFEPDSLNGLAALIREQGREFGFNLDSSQSSKGPGLFGQFSSTSSSIKIPKKLNFELNFDFIGNSEKNTNEGTVNCCGSEDTLDSNDEQISELTPGVERVEILPSFEYFPARSIT